MPDRGIEREENGENGRERVKDWEREKPTEKAMVEETKRKKEE